MTWEMTWNLEEGTNFRKMLSDFCHWDFEIMMEALSSETLNSFEHMGWTLGKRGQDLR